MECPGHTAPWGRPQGRDAARSQLPGYTHSYRVTILWLETQLERTSVITCIEQVRDQQHRPKAPRLGMTLTAPAAYRQGVLYDYLYRVRGMNISSKIFSLSFLKRSYAGTDATTGAFPPPLQEVPQISY